MSVDEIAGLTPSLVSGRDRVPGPAQTCDPSSPSLSPPRTASGSSARTIAAVAGCAPQSTDKLDFTAVRIFTGVNYDTSICQTTAPCSKNQTQNRIIAKAIYPAVGQHRWRCRAPQAPENERRRKAKNCRSGQSAVGENQGAEVSRRAGQESPAQNERGGAGKDCGGSQSTLGESQGRRQKKAVGDYQAHTPSGHNRNSVWINEPLVR